MSGPNRSRRTFLMTSVYAMGALGVTSAIYAMATSMGMSDAERAKRTTVDIDLNTIAPGNQIQTTINQNRYYVRHRTTEEIEATANDDIAPYRDKNARNANITSGSKATAINRSFGRNGAYVLVSAMCTYSIPVLLTEYETDGSAWLCGHCGAKFDSVGRVVKGPAKENLAIPRFTVSDKNILSVVSDG